MLCPLCDNRSRVLDSRQAEDGAAVRRRRRCDGCGHRFTTFERIAVSVALVRKRDGSRQELDPAKLRAGLERAAHKRPEAERAVELIVRSVLAEASRGGEITSKRIGELCLCGLREADQVAYLRYASVHKQLDGTEAIRAELSALSAAELEGVGDGLAALAAAGWPGESANAADFDRDSRRGGEEHPPHFDNESTGREVHA